MCSKKKCSHIISTLGSKKKPDDEYFFLFLTFFFVITYPKIYVTLENIKQLLIFLCFSCSAIWYFCTYDIFVQNVILLSLWRALEYFLYHFILIEICTRVFNESLLVSFWWKTCNIPISLFSNKIFGSAVTSTMQKQNYFPLNSLKNWHYLFLLIQLKSILKNLILCIKIYHVWVSFNSYRYTSAVFMYNELSF